MVYLKSSGISVKPVNAASKAYWRRNIEESSKHSAYWIFYIFSTYYKKVKQQYWSTIITSNTLDLEKGVLTMTSPKIITNEAL